jgi:thiol-disulfide isomerase/thioredoxin
VTNARLFSLVGAAALLAGALFWSLGRPPGRLPSVEPGPAIAPAALYAASFDDPGGGRRALGQFQGKVLVLNFWATWCEPCRAEMPAFDRLHRRWSPRGVQFVGLSDEAPDVAARFGRQFDIAYPLWTGGDAVADLSRRLGNNLGGLPYTVVLDPQGGLLTRKVGPYTEAELEAILEKAVAKSAKPT